MWFIAGNIFRFVSFGSPICLTSIQVILTLFYDWLWALWLGGCLSKTFKRCMELKFQNSGFQNWFLHLQRLNPELKNHVYNPSFVLRSSWKSVHKHLFHFLECLCLCLLHSWRGSTKAPGSGRHVYRSGSFLRWIISMFGRRKSDFFFVSVDAPNLNSQKAYSRHNQLNETRACFSSLIQHATQHKELCGSPCGDRVCVCCWCPRWMCCVGT